MLWLWLFGLDLLMTWGLLAFLFNFIPAFGSAMTAILPIAYAAFTRDFGTAGLIAARLLVFEQVMGNYVNPKVQGRQVAISPLVILIALLGWGWMWGIAGAVLAVPITIAIMILCAHVDGLRSVALILSDKSDIAALDGMLGLDA